MSRIYFHSKDADAEVRGTERAHAGVMCNDFLVAALHLRSFRLEEDPLLKLIPADSYVHGVEPRALEQTLTTYLHVDGKFIIDGETIDSFTVGLNTLVAMGNDALIFQARLHGQCEIHGWVDGPGRAWLAGIIDKGLDLGILRHGAGWDDVTTLLRSSDKGVVATSYSVCEQFPSAELAKEAGLFTPGPDHQGFWTKENQPDHPHLWGQPWWDGDEWYDLSDDEQWRIGVESLRTHAPEWKRPGWSQRFGSGHSAFDIRRIADERRVAAT